ncbi:MAG: SWIM zinc finger family protein [Chloroflexota bacterium]
MKPRQLKALQAKSKRLTAHAIQADRRENAFIVIVGSGTSSTFNHIVTVKFNKDGTIAARCTCPWAEHGGIACSHVIAALSKLAALKHRALSFWLTPEEAARQKRSVFQLTSGTAKEEVWITSREAA